MVSAHGGLQVRTQVIGATIVEHVVRDDHDCGARLPLAGAILASLLVCGGLQARSGKKMKGLIVYGEGFSFMVKEPDGWRSDIGKIAGKYGANVVFLPSAQESRKLDVTIRVRVNQKQDENTIEDLNCDMQEYSQKYPEAEFSDLAAAHGEYATFAKLVLSQSGSTSTLRI